MATLNLVPNPAVLVTQGVIFLGNMFIIKKLMVDPYLHLRDRREAATTGNQAEAERLRAECQVLSDKIAARIRATADETRALRESLREKALERRRVLVAEAEAEARATVDRVSDEVAKALAAERQKIPEVVNALTAEVYARALH